MLRQNNWKTKRLSLLDGQQAWFKRVSLWDKKQTFSRSYEHVKIIRKLSYVVVLLSLWATNKGNVLVLFLVTRFCCCFLNSTWRLRAQEGVDFCFLGNPTVGHRFRGPETKTRSPQRDKRINFCVSLAKITFAARRKRSLLGSQAVREQDIGPQAAQALRWRHAAVNYKEMYWRF